MEKYNAEGYPDPTAVKALANVVRNEKAKSYRPCVFICSPYAGDIKTNVDKTKRYLRFAVDKGAIPFAPHLLYPQVMDEHDSDERKLGLFFGMVWLRKCYEIWVFGSHISSGMRTEIDKAKKHHIAIRYFTENCKEVVSK